MKTLSTLLLAIAISFNAAADVLACRTDGCDMRRNQQIAALFTFLMTSDDLGGMCSGVNSSLLRLERVNEELFIVICGENFKHSEKIKVTVLAKEDGSYTASVSK